MRTERNETSVCAILKAPVASIVKDAVFACAILRLCAVLATKYDCLYTILFPCHIYSISIA
jgi:hypothetical protein